MRNAYGPDGLVPEVLHAVEEVYYVAVKAVRGKGVDGEIAPREILGKVRDERDAVRMPLVGVGSFGAKRRDLEGIVLEEDRDGAVLDACGNDVAEHRDDFFGFCVRAEVEVAVGDAKKVIAYRSTDYVEPLAVVTEDGGESADVLGYGILLHAPILPP